MSQPLRTFIALPLPDEVKARLGTVAGRLREQLPRKSVRWVTPERMHLTLAFLGDTAPQRVAEVSAGIDEVTGAHRPVALTLTHFGCFPNPRRPRVLWVGVEDHDHATARLQQRLSAMLAPLGWPPDDRPFRAHLTLGRVRNRAKIRLTDVEVEIEPLTFTIDALHFYSSELSPNGPRYTLLHRAPLGP